MKFDQRGGGGSWNGRGISLTKVHSPNMYVYTCVGSNQGNYTYIEGILYQELVCNVLPNAGNKGSASSRNSAGHCLSRAATNGRGNNSPKSRVVFRQQASLGIRQPQPPLYSGILTRAVVSNLPFLSLISASNQRLSGVALFPQRSSLYGAVVSIQRRLEKETST